MTKKSQKIQPQSSLAVEPIDRTTDYAQRVLSGEVVAGPHVRNACRRHMDDLRLGADRGLHFDQEAASRAFRFFEGVLKLSEGQFEGKPFLLHESQSFIIGSLFGWMRSDGTRRFRRAYIEQAKGNGKSPACGGIGIYGLCADGEAGSQVYAVAAKKDQAAILFQDAVRMVRASPSLSDRITFSGGIGREFNMAHHGSGSFFRPVSREAGKSGSGPRPYFVLADEVHEMPDGAILEMMERGFKFRQQPLLVMITNSGSDRNSVAWHEREWAIKVASGNENAVTDPTYQGVIMDGSDDSFSFVCSLDDGDNPLQDESCWIKANPLLGITVTKEYLRGVVAQAKNIPAKQNNILRLHFCMWTDSDVAWMNREVVEPLLADFDRKQHHGKPMFVGLDLSQNRDITAMGCVVKTGEKDGKPTFDAWVEAWTPGDTVRARAESDGMKYLPLWVQEGHINAPSGENINYRHVAQTMAEYAHDYDIKMVAFDRYAYRRFEDECRDIGLQLNFVEHPQGGTKKGKPTPAMEESAKRAGKVAEGLWFPASMRLLEDAMLEGRVRFLRNPVLVSAIMSAVVEQDKWDNKWLSKQKAANKIDAAVALVMAFGAANSIHIDPPKYRVRFFGGG